MADVTMGDLGALLPRAIAGAETAGTRIGKKQVCEALHTIASFAEVDGADPKHVEALRTKAETFWSKG